MENSIGLKRVNSVSIHLKMGFSKLLYSYTHYHSSEPGPEVINELGTKFILLINVKMPTIVGILTFISMINTTSKRLKARNFFIVDILIL